MDKPETCVTMRYGRYKMTREVTSLELSQYRERDRLGDVAAEMLKLLRQADAS